VALLTVDHVRVEFGGIVALADLSFTIDEGQIKLKELVQDGAGEWVERQSALQLLEAQK